MSQTWMHARLEWNAPEGTYTTRLALYRSRRRDDDWEMLSIVLTNEQLTELTQQYGIKPVNVVDEK